MLLFLEEMTGFTCGGADILKVIKFVWQLLDIVFIMVPIGLIVMVSVDFAKNVMAGKEDEMKKNLNLAMKRFLFCVALFLVSPIVEFAINMLGEDLGVDFMECVNIAITEDDLDQYKVDYDDYDNPSEPNFSKKSGYSANKGGASNFKDVDFTHLNIYNQNGSHSREYVCEDKSGGTVGSTACGLSTYMATRYVLTRENTNFMDFAHEACKTGLYNGKGTSWSYAESGDYPTKYGINGTSITNDWDTIVSELSKDHVVVQMIQAGRQTTTEGGFNGTENAHFIALVAYDGAKVYVYNPTGENTGWQSKDIIQKYVIDVAKLTRSMKAV